MTFAEEAADINPNNESKYIKAAAAGDGEAFGELVRAYEKLVFNTVKSKVQNHEDALDLSQEVFIKIWRALPNWRGECKFSTWVYKVCLNASLDFLRQTPERIPESLSGRVDEDGEEHPLDVADDSVSASPESSLERSETSFAVRRAIARLSDDQRRVILLRDIEGYTYDEIAEMLDLGIGTVKSRLNRARTNLRALLEDERLLDDGSHGCQADGGKLKHSRAGLKG